MGHHHRKQAQPVSSSRSREGFERGRHKIGAENRRNFTAAYFEGEGREGRGGAPSFLYLKNASSLILGVNFRGATAPNRPPPPGPPFSFPLRPRYLAEFRAVSGRPNPSYCDTLETGRTFHNILPSRLIMYVRSAVVACLRACVLHIDDSKPCRGPLRGGG